MSYYAHSDFPREFHQSINPHQAEFDRLVTQSLVRRIGSRQSEDRAHVDIKDSESIEIVLKDSL